MNLQQFLAFIAPLASMIEPVLLNLEQNQVHPELQKLIEGVSSPDLKLLLTCLDKALDEFAQAEIKKLG